MKKTNRQSSIRYAIQQPALPAYRRAFFEKLSQNQELSPKLFYSSTKDLSNDDQTDCDKRFVPCLQFQLPFLGILILDPTPLRLVFRKEFRVLVLSGNFRNPFLLPSIVVAKIFRKPTLLWTHGRSKSPSRLRDFIRGKITNLCSGLILYDSVTAETLAKAGHIHVPIYVAPNAVEAPEAPLKVPNALPPLGTEKCKEASRSSCFTLLHVSRLQQSNRLDVAIRAMGLAQERDHDVELICVGLSIDNEEERLRSLAAELGLSDKVRFLGPIYDSDRLAQWFAKADAFVYPSNVGLSLLHAFNHGLPALIGDCTEKHNPEVAVFQHRKNGLSFEHDSPAALTDAIEQLACDFGLRESLSQQARDTTSSKHSMSKMVAGFEQAVQAAANA